MLRYIELDSDKHPLHKFKTEEDKRKYSQLDCECFSNSALLVPKDVIVIDFDNDNIIKDNSGNIISSKEEFLINYLINNYSPYWTKSQKNHYHLYFKRPKNLKINNWVDYFTCGGFQVDYRTENNGMVIVKTNGIMREAKEKLTDDVINNLPELPLLCYPLHNNKDIKTSFIDMIEGDGRNTSLFNHIIEVYRNFNFKSNKLLEIGKFINENLFKEPLNDNVVESFSKRAKNYNIKNTILDDENYCKEIDLICFDDVKQRNTSWLWHPYIPIGKLTIITGDPGIGKSYLTLDWASRVSNGEPFPFYDENVNLDDISEANVIFQNGEDGIEDTIKERLIKCRANQKNIYIINEVDNPIFSLYDTERFESILMEIRPKLVIIDPIQRYIGDISMNSANEVRQLLAPISNLANKYNCAIVLVMHRNKSKNTDDIYRALGSIDFVGIARSVLTIAYDKNFQKTITQTKSSLGKKGESIIFDILDDGPIYIEKKEFISSTVDKLGPREEAKEFLINILKENNNIMRSLEIFDAAKEIEIAIATLNRAKKELNIRSKQIQGKWYWELEHLDEEYQDSDKKTDNLII